MEPSLDSIMVPVPVQSSAASRTGRHLEIGGGAPLLHVWDRGAPRQQPVTHTYIIIISSNPRLVRGGRHQRLALCAAA